jgi:hypothetical protein
VTIHILWHHLLLLLLLLLEVIGHACLLLLLRHLLGATFHQSMPHGTFSNWSCKAATISILPAAPATNLQHPPEYLTSTGQQRSSFRPAGCSSQQLRYN